MKSRAKPQEESRGDADVVRLAPQPHLEATGLRESHLKTILSNEQDERGDERVEPLPPPPQQPQLQPLPGQEQQLIVEVGNPSP